VHTLSSSRLALFSVDGTLLAQRAFGANRQSAVAHKSYCGHGCDNIHRLGRVLAAGAEFDIKPFGIRLMDSLRLEKSRRLIPRKMSIE
jgi:hypothetical protein